MAGEDVDIGKVAKGEVLVTQGELGSELFVVLDGVLDGVLFVVLDGVLDGVLVVEAGGDPVAELVPGATTGERAILEAGKRTSTLRAVLPVKVAAAGPSTVAQGPRRGRPGPPAGGGMRAAGRLRCTAPS